ncbi:MAG: hypothetical protein COA50_15570 [Flavobacteriaceae bacterium]|nr:MAG: hypothetical protein COA50_15570 [Flavobacteriaceae bacterium]
MKALYENINVAINSSMKVATYSLTESCETSNWHVHPEYELVYIKNGYGLLRIGTKAVPYTNGALLFLGPNIQHTDFGNRIHKDNLEVVIQFGKEFVHEKLAVFPEFTSIKRLMKNSERVLIFNDEIKTELSEKFETFDTLNTTQKLINLMWIFEKLSTASNHKKIYGHTPIVSHKSSEIYRLEVIFDYINSHYSEKIALDTLADQVGLTINSLCRFFKKMTQKSIMGFVAEYRIRKAVELFNLNTTSTISEVMYKCGYNDASYFTKQFKKYQNTSPSKYLGSIKL